MDPLVLPDGWTLGSIEQSMHKIVVSAGKPLQLKKGFVGSRRGAMHDAARLQLLVTWARLANEPYLYYHGANDSDSVLAELCSHAPGITALRLCNGVNVGEEYFTRRESLEKAAAKMEATDLLVWPDIIRGRAIDFTCVSGSTVQYLRPLFTTRNFFSVKGAEQMFGTLSLLSNYVLKRDQLRIPPSLIKACAIFASELIKNTQQHATTDHRNQPYLAHAEGLIISWSQMDEKFYKKDFEGHQRLLDFWDREKVDVRDGAEKALRCLHLSFFDTGPGFASRATGRLVQDLSLHEERQELMKALQKNISTKSETGGGNGLPGVLQALREIGGMMSIRSGRLNIFNVFTPGEARDLFQFDDWSNQDLAPAAGAVVSLLIPIRRHA